VAAAVQAEGLKYLTYLDAPTRDFEKKNADTSGLIDYIASDLELPEDLVDLILLRDRLEAAIAQLPDAQAKAVRLRFGLDDRVARSQSEAALILGCSKGYAATCKLRRSKTEATADR
jgi:DNA-directed RNA polymerase sigma subunit (sigma70/sigma32)